jgi:hypothetical protein
LNDKSDEYAKEFADQVKTYYGHVGINTVNYSAPLYIVDSVAPSVRVSLWDCWKNGFRDAKLARDIAVVPIPAFAEASGGTDSEMAVYQTGTDTLWEFWKAQKVDGAWRACWGGRMPNVSSSSGIWRHPYGAAGTGLPFFAGQIQIQELQRGEINHVMGIALVRGLKGRFSWPANRSDGRAATGIPEGMRLRLDPSIDVDSLKLHPIARAIAKAAQTYGFVVWDMAGSVSLRAENPKPYTLQGKPNPYVKLFNGTPTYAVMNGFPWDRMQFMPENYGKE